FRYARPASLPEPREIARIPRIFPPLPLAGEGRGEGRPCERRRSGEGRGEGQAFRAVSSPALPVGALPKLVIGTPMPLASVVRSWFVGASLSLAVPLPAVILMYWPCLTSP